MNAHTLTFPLAAALLALCAGCGSASDYGPNQTARGAAAGAATGAVLGGVIGSNSDKVSTEKGAAIGAVAGGLAGAAIGHQVDQREASAGTAAPVYSSTSTAPVSADSSYTVQTIPPAPVSEPQESVPPQPSANAVWIRGHYSYTGNGYQWQPGRWEVPPAGARQYIGPTWQPAANGGYVYVRGHWQ
jgi:hypothetical protein